MKARPTLMRERLSVYPFQGHGEDRLFLARFELPKFEEEFQIPKSAWRALKLRLGGALPTEGDKPAGFIHFLAGFPIDTVEMLMLIGEYSSTKEISKINILKAVCPGQQATAPVPKPFFKWPVEEMLLLNKTALLEYAALFFADNLPGEPEPTKPHWWFRYEMVAKEGQTFPVPGEFLALGVRMMPGEYWGRKQLSSPFIYAGNWMDTVYLTSAVIKEIIDPDDTYPYCRYIVQWRKYEITANPSDFATYEVDDRISVLKDCAIDKKSQLWKDDDQHSWGENWMVAPISFYGEDKEE